MVAVSFRPVNVEQHLSYDYARLMATKTPKFTTKRDAAQAKRASAKEAAKVNGPGPRPAKKLSQIEAAVEVLRAASKPMNCKAMVETMSAKGSGVVTRKEGFRGASVTPRRRMMMIIGREPRFKRISGW
jgi:multidrug resistance efflux pump